MIDSADGFPGSIPKLDTLVDLLRWRALHQPRRTIYTFLTDGETEEECLTCEELDRRARATGAMLQALGATGKRALLLYPPGLEYIAGFWGCLYAGVVAVPAYPPDPARLNRTLPRLQAMVADAQAEIVLTTTPIRSMAEFLFGQAPDLAALEWLVTDSIADGREANWREPALTGDTLAFLQYTSGSTRTPRGVMLNHDNLLHNLMLIHQAFGVLPQDRGVIWLPPYHDMGLIGGILQPVYAGISCILMSPVSFLQRPFRWLQAISRYRAMISGGPNFAYDLCVRKTTPEQRATLDLSSWSLAFNGAEPVRPETLDRFVAAFESRGFRREAFYSCYGLAEATLIVSGGSRTAPPVLYSVAKAALEHNQIKAAEGNEDAQTSVGCGQSLGGQEIAIVHPESLTRCPSDQVGEVWVSGPSVALGYWNRPEETEQLFGARLVGTGEGPFLRTGDLGFLRDGELFLTGRIKDLIIIRGRNHYPQDIELTAEQSHPVLRPGCGAAFSVDVAGEEQLVVVQEVDTRQQPDMDQAVNAVRRAVAEAHEVQVHTMVLIEPRSIPKTSSGKIQRHACRAEFLAGTLEVVRSSVVSEADAEKTVTSLTRQALLEAEPGERQSLLEAHLRERMADALRVAPSQLDSARPLNTLGLDSVMVVDLASELESGWGVHLPASDLLQDITISQLASKVLAELSSPSDTSILAGEPLAEYALSRGQRALWFVNQLTPESGAYNLVNAVRIRAEMDVPAMQRTFEKLVDHHPALRTTFAAPGGNPVQRIHEHMSGFFFHEDASTWSEEQLNRRLADEVYRPFDLERGPLIRVIVFTRSPQDHIMMLSIHHIVADLWSVAVILYGAGVLYPAEKAGLPASLKPPRAQYSDYIRQQEEMLAGQEGERLWNFWSKQLAGELPVLNLPTDRPRPLVQTYRGASRTIRLGVELSQRLESVAKSHGVALHMVLLAAFQALLYRYTGQEDLLIGYPKAGRSQKWSRLVGYLVNTIVLRADLSGNPTFAELLERVRQMVTEAFEHDAYPFSLLVERLQPARDLSLSPLFQVMFGWQKTTRLLDGQSLTSLALSETGRGIELGGLPMEAYPLEQRVVPFDLSLLMAEEGGELVALMEYNTDLFDPTTITRMLGHFRTLVEGIVAGPDQRLASLPLLTEAERHQLLIEWNANKTREASAPCIHRLFEIQAERTPEAIAVVLDKEELTYRELNRRANQLARHLQRLGVGPEAPVGMCVERSVEMIVGLLGIFKAGGVYLPLDPAYPRERLTFMLNDSRSLILATQQPLLDRLPEHQAHTICLDADWPAVAQESDANLPSSATLESLAYVLYTSGSTGEPKGVLITHGALANHCRDVQRYYKITPSDRALQFASLNFDASLEQIFTALIAGATLVLRGPELPDARRFNQMVADYGLTVVNVPPAYWHQWAQACVEASDLAPNTQLRLAIIGGDIVLPETLALWHRTPMRAARLLNAYGPTETTITATTFEAPLQSDALWFHQRVPIGRPLVNRTAYILDRCGNPVPIGVPGELYIGGAGLARGYLDRPELDAEKFIADPFSAEPAARLYRTGDLACYLPDGNIEFLGRLDQQVKIRGIRVELGEIETALNQHPAVRDAIVLVWDQEIRGRRGTDRPLVAYIVLHPGESLTIGELQGFLREKLPTFMLPSAYMFLESLPINVSGKLDRRALPAPDLARPDLTAPFVAPRTPVEEELARIWAEALGVERVGIHDNFFELGGHSLLATQLISRLRDVFQVELPLRRFFEMSTVAGLAVALAQCQAEQVSSDQVAQLLAELEQLPEDEARVMLANGTLSQ